MIARLLLAAVALTGLVTAFPGESAATDAGSLKEQIVGTWIFVSSSNTRSDGSRFNRWGSNPKGIFMFDGKGNYSQMITRPDVGVFGAKTVSSYGTYSVDEANKILITNIVASSFPKLNGTSQRRAIVNLTADELKYVNRATASGTTVEAIWKRFK